MVNTLAVIKPPVKVPPAPLPGAVKVTVTPLTGFPPESFTVATNGLAKVVLIVALCGVPPVAVTLAGATDWFVRLKLAVPATPDALATTVKLPAVALAVNAGAVAAPLTPVSTMTAVPEPPKAPLAPLPGAVKVTATPLTGFPPESFTVATNGLAKAVLIVALCGVPPVAVTLAGATDWFV